MNIFKKYFLFLIILLFSMFILLLNNKQTQSPVLPIPISSKDLKNPPHITYESETQAESISINKNEDEPVDNGSPSVLLLEIHYSGCNHTHTISTDIPTNLTLEELEIAYDDCILKSATDDRIVFEKFEDGKCNQHYIIKEKDGMVAVFFDSPIENVVLKEMTDISYETISQSYKKEIEKGLFIDSDNELSLTLSAIALSSLVLENP